MKKVVGIIAGLATLITLTLCKEQSKRDEAGNVSPYLNHHDTVKYIGSKQCIQCHTDMGNTFFETGMGKSFDTASRLKSSAVFKNIKPVYDTFLDLYYFPSWQNNALYLTEYRLKGKDTIHKRIEKISYIIGSGHHTNSHMTEENGYVFQAPLTFYTQKGQWDLPPGFEGGHNTRFSRKIGMECLSCHNSLPTYDKQSDNRYTEIPHGISCERCHGPGEIHVQQKSKGLVVDTSKYIDYTIVNPRKLSWQRQIDICQRCHLQGNAVLKPGKNFEDFRPGMVLSNTFDQFSPEYENGDQFIMAAHAERFQQSKCFLSSVKGNIDNENAKVGFTCISCHNPHISVRSTNTNIFNSKCQSCHSTSEQVHCNAPQKSLDLEANNCVKCHMPSSATVDIPHVSVHDHYIRKPVKGVAKSDLKLKGLRCITNKNPDDNTLAEAYISYFEKFDNNKLYLEKAKEQIKKLNAGNQVELQTIIHYNYMAGAYLNITQLATPQKYFDDAWTNYRVSKAFEKIGQFELASQWMEACLRLQSTNLDFILQNGILLLKNKQTAQASENFKKLNLLYSKNAESWAYLGIIHLQKSEYLQAQTYFNKALMLDPDLEIALENMRLMFQTTGNSLEVQSIDQRLAIIRARKKAR
ncbi:MAG: tetratricopeptide repeat protein [Bacteroidota bacterium]